VGVGVGVGVGVCVGGVATCSGPPTAVSVYTVRLANLGPSRACVACSLAVCCGFGSKPKAHVVAVW
jgi:hypothetical protein